MIFGFSWLLAPEALHIPDGFLSTPVALVGWAVAIAVVAYALRQTRDSLGERQIPLLGVMAAFIFAAQAINFPVAGGTSGHLLGGALAAIVLGPWSAVLVMTAVIGLQGLLFQDGGLLVMGWNIVNMGVLTVLTASLVYAVIRRLLGQGRIGLIVGGAGAAWLSVEAGALATAVELGASGTMSLGLAVVSMATVHAFIGLGEALITAGALLLVASSRTDLLAQGRDVPGQSSAAMVAVGLLIALAIALFSFVASPAPDGLERVAIDHGFMGQALEPAFKLLPDYQIPFLASPVASGIAAVILGVLVVFVVAILISFVGRRKRAESSMGPADKG